MKNVGQSTPSFTAETVWITHAAAKSSASPRQRLLSPRSWESGFDKAQGAIPVHCKPGMHLPSAFRNHRCGVHAGATWKSVLSSHHQRLGQTRQDQKFIRERYERSDPLSQRQSVKSIRFLCFWYFPRHLYPGSIRNHSHLHPIQ